MELNQLKKKRINNVITFSIISHNYNVENSPAVKKKNYTAPL